MSYVQNLPQRRDINKFLQLSRWTENPDVAFQWVSVRIFYSFLVFLEDHIYLQNDGTELFLLVRRSICGLHLMSNTDKPLDLR